MGKDRCLIMSIVCAVIVLIMLLFFGCMPSKKSNMTLGEKVTAPQGYTEMQIRKAVKNSK